MQANVFIAHGDRSLVILALSLPWLVALGKSFSIVPKPLIKEEEVLNIILGILHEAYIIRWPGDPQKAPQVP